MKLRKTLAVLIALVMTLTMFGIAASAQAGEPQNHTINITVVPGASVQMRELLAELGFCFYDVSSSQTWDVRRTGRLTLLTQNIRDNEIWTAQTVQGPSNDYQGKSQVRFDMECGSIVLVNVTVTRSTWQAISNVLFEPIFWGIALFITGIGAPLGLLILIASPVFWVSGFISLLRPTSYYEINPPLVLD